MSSGLKHHLLKSLMSTDKKIKSVALKWGHTFNWWMLEEPSEVKMIDVSELKTYESKYMMCFNHIKSRGWLREDRMWVSPDRKYKFNNIEAAYRCCRFYEEVVV